MTIRSIKLAADPLLHQTAQEVHDVNSPRVKQTIEDLIDTLRHKKGLGIAANQIGVPLQIMIIHISNKSAKQEKCEPVPLTVFINPQIEVLEDQGMNTHYEACFSLPGLMGKVPRHKAIKYTALNSAGERVEGIVKDFHARVFQHEVDHLRGKLYWTHIHNCEDFGFCESFSNQLISRLLTFSARYIGYDTH